MGKKLEGIRFKGVRVDLDRERHIRYTFSGLEYLAEKYGDLTTAFAALQETAKGKMDKTTIGAIIDFAYAGLMHEDRELTRDDVADILDLQSMQELVGCISEALIGSMPEATENP